MVWDKSWEVPYLEIHTTYESLDASVRKSLQAENSGESLMLISRLMCVIWETWYPAILVRIFYLIDILSKMFDPAHMLFIRVLDSHAKDFLVHAYYTCILVETKNSALDMWKFTANVNLCSGLFACLFVCPHLFACIFAFVHIIYAYIYIIYLYIHIYMHMFIYIFVCVYIYIYLYVYVLCYTY